MEKTTEQQVEAATSSIEDMIAEAELEASADNAASGDLEDEAAQKAMEENGQGGKGEEKPYQVTFRREYTFGTETDTKIYRSIDLSGLLDLTTVDAERFDRIMAKLGHNPVNKFRDTTYTKHVAMHVTGLPVEFFNTLGIRDMLAVTAEVYNYFLFG